MLEFVKICDELVTGLTDMIISIIIIVGVFAAILTLVRRVELWLSEIFISIIIIIHRIFFSLRLPQKEKIV